jgi:N-acetylglutamate synthase-like GNAT family acetyltransferase
MERTLHASTRTKRGNPEQRGILRLDRKQHFTRRDVTLIRHAYVLTSHQRKGLGEKLLKHLLSLAKTSSIYAGTWETAPWAIKFYQKHGFKLVSRGEKNKLLKKYWNIPERQVETSVVLELKRQPQ